MTKGKLSLFILLAALAGGELPAKAYHGNYSPEWANRYREWDCWDYHDYHHYRHHHRWGGYGRRHWHDYGRWSYYRPSYYRDYYRYSYRPYHRREVYIASSGSSVAIGGRAPVPADQKCDDATALLKVNQELLAKEPANTELAEKNRTLKDEVLEACVPGWMKKAAEGKPKEEAVPAATAAL